MSFQVESRTRALGPGFYISRLRRFLDIEVCSRHSLKHHEATGKEMCDLSGAVLAERDLSTAVLSNEEQRLYFDPASAKHR